MGHVRLLRGATIGAVHSWRRYVRCCRGCCHTDVCCRPAHGAVTIAVHRRVAAGREQGRWPGRGCGHGGDRGVLMCGRWRWVWWC